MENLLIYLLKSAGLLSLFFAAYYFLLKNDTSFRLNRMFLLGGLIAALALPSVEFTRTVVVENTSAAWDFQEFATSSSALPQVQQKTVTDWWQIAGIAYLLGLGIFLLKFLVQLGSLLKFLKGNNKSKDKNFTIIHTAEELQPFSFFNFIILNPALHEKQELEMILQHEKTHARQWHSIDVLFSTLAVYLLWFNPLSWLYKNSVVQNLEYLADKEVIAEPICKTEYQKTLLKIAVGDFQPALANSFYQSFIKKRIMMLNKNSTQESNFWKAGIVVPFIFLFIITFNVRTVAQEVSDGSQQEITSTLEVSSDISKKTTRESLKNLQRIFKKQGVELDFDGIEYSEDGYLTDLTITYERLDNGQSGNRLLSNPNGIETFQIYTNQKETGFRKASNSGKPKDAMSGSAFSNLGEAPLYIVENKQYRAENLLGKYIQVNGEMSILAPPEAVEQFGERGADGAIVITKGEIISDFEAALKKIDSENKQVERNYIKVEKDRFPTLINLENNPTKKNEKKESPQKFKEGKFGFGGDDIPAIHRENEEMKNFSFQDRKPLIVVEGEIKDKDFSFSTMDQSMIKSLNVLRGESAVEKYGKKAENGVIEIDLKSEDDIKASQNPSEESRVKGEGKATVSFSANMLEFEEAGDKKRTSVTLSGVEKAELKDSNALFVINGKEMAKDFDPESIANEDIKSISVLNGKKATDKYGNKAKDGVIEITTKD